MIIGFDSFKSFKCIAIFTELLLSGSVRIYEECENAEETPILNCFSVFG